MAVKATPATRAPRGTKTLTQAFFSAAENVPEVQRDAVVKAALAAIRDQLKEGRAKTKAAKVKARGKAAPAARQTVSAKQATPRPRARSARPETEAVDDTDPA